MVLLEYQIKPDSQKVWFLMGGRGGGKTTACAYYTNKYAEENPHARIAILHCGNIYTCVSTLQLINPEIIYSKKQLEWTNGSKANFISTKSIMDLGSFSRTVQGLWYYKFMWLEQVDNWEDGLTEYFLNLVKHSQSEVVGNFSGEKLIKYILDRFPDSVSVLPMITNKYLTRAYYEE